MKEIPSDWTPPEKKLRKYQYVLIEHRPYGEGPGLEFFSDVENLDDKPDLWEQECPYGVSGGRVVKPEDRGDWEMK